MQAVVAVQPVGRGDEESQRAQPVVDGDDHHAAGCEAVADVLGAAARAVQKRPAVDPQQDGEGGVAVALRGGGGPDVEEQAVLALHALDLGRAPAAAVLLLVPVSTTAAVVAGRRREGGGLVALGAELEGLQHPGVPRRLRLRRTEPQRIDRRFRVRDAQERVDRPGTQPSHVPQRRLHQHGVAPQPAALLAPALHPRGDCKC